MNIYGPEARSFRTELLKALPRLLLPLAVTEAGLTPKAQAGRDLGVQVRTPSGRRRTLAVKIIADGSPSRIAQGLYQLSRPRPAGAYPVAASRFLSPGARRLCREAGVGYLDLAGNCHLQFNDLYLEKVVDKNPFPRRGRPPSVFSPVSSRILRVLLEEPARAWQVVTLSHTAQVSAGQTSNVCRRLIAEASAQREQRRLHLSRPADLLSAWRDARALRQSTVLAYYSFEQDPERLMARVAQVAAERGLRYAVTSFGAASLIAPFVRGIGTLQWYLDAPEAVDGWVEALNLRPVEAGPNVVMRIPYDSGVFYRTQTVHGVSLVGNVQLYLDLCDESGRGREQADFLRKERLGF